MLVCAAGFSPAAGGAEQQETETTEQPDQQGAPEGRAAQGKQPPQSNSSKVTYLSFPTVSIQQAGGSTNASLLSLSSLGVFRFLYFTYIYLPLTF